jgi:ABC-type antimicrobial peptide transport system permease subunit
MQVVGVARDGKYRTLGESPRPFIYVPLAQHYHPELAVLVRSDARRISNEITAVIAGLAPTLPIVRSGTLSEMTAFGLIPHRLAATVAAAAGLIALLLASIGVYGVIAFDVAQRTREIGIRLALGAIRREVTTMVLRRSMAMVVTGAVMGLALAALASQLLDALLFGLAPLDPLSFVGALALILFAATIAAIVPVRKAVGINPVDALRAE